MADENRTMDVAVLGLGNMGRALAEALLKRGHRVTVWNRTAAKADALISAGALAAHSAVEAASACDVIVTCVLDGAAVRSVLETVAAQTTLAGKSVLQMTTVAPCDSVALEQLVQARGASYLDGAILGYPTDVIEGSARIALSGSQDAFERLASVIAALTRLPAYVGERTGAAFVMDKVVYAQFYGIAHAYLQAAAMAKAAGIPLDEFLSVTGGEERWSWKGRTMDGFVKMAEACSYEEAGATLAGHAAAYGQVLETMRDLGLDTTVAAGVSDTIARAIEFGHAEHELAAIFEVLLPSAAR